MLLHQTGHVHVSLNMLGTVTTKSCKRRWQLGLKHMQVLLWQQRADSGFKLATMVGIGDPITGTHLAVLFDLSALTCMPGFIVQSEA